MTTTAVISPCGRYRYSLSRIWDIELPTLSWCMLNPSTADAVQDDPTVRKCVGFARRWGFGSIHVVNLFAWRATDPRELDAVEDPVGPDADRWIQRAFRCPVVVAWGAGLPRRCERTAQRIALVREAAGASATCLGLTKAGEPRHPLMLAYATERQPWPVGGRKSGDDDDRDRWDERDEEDA